MVEKRKKTRSTSSSVDPTTRYAMDVASGKEIAGPDIWGVVNKPVPQRGNTYAVSMLWPVNMSVAEIAAADCPDDCRGDGMWLYQDGKVAQRVHSPEELRKKAEAEKVRRLAEAESAIAPLARAVKLKIATDEEIKRLDAWELYSVMVNRVDTASPDWPDVPVSQ